MEKTAMAVSAAVIFGAGAAVMLRAQACANAAVGADERIVVLSGPERYRPGPGWIHRVDTPDRGTMPALTPAARGPRQGGWTPLP